MQRIGIRVDSSPEIGAGHLFRCLTLAHQFIMNKIDVIFICVDYPENLINQIKSKNFKVITLNFKHYSKKNLKFEYIDVNVCIKVLTENNIFFDLLIVDHYQLNIFWESSLKPFYNKLAVIDDLANRKHNADYLIDQTHNRQASEYQKLVPNNCKLLLGSSYSLLKENFLKLRKHAILKREEVAKNLLYRSKINILVSLGASDTENISMIVLSALITLKIKYNNIIATVILTTLSPHKDQIIEKIAKYEWISLVLNTKTMEKYILAADIAIGSSGITSLERCYLGLPSLIITDAENQIEMAGSIDKYGAAINLGHYKKLSSDKINTNIEKILTSPIKYKSISQQAFKICDGKGSKRAAKLIALGIRGQKNDSLYNP